MLIINKDGLILPRVKLFVSVFGGSIGLIWTSIEILEHFKIDLSYLDGLGKLSIYFIAIHSLLFSLIALYFIEIFKLSDIKDKDIEKFIEKDAILVKDLTDSLLQALRSKNYLEVIRIGTALSRPFFESGNYKARLQIGIIVEEAAAIVHNLPIQMKELIDSIGWSHVELGQLDEGERNILHGYEIAKKLSDHFYTSKALRHLGAICRRREQYDKSESYYKDAILFAKKINEKTPKTELLAGINYAQASLYLHQKSFNEALSHIDEAILGFSNLGDYYKVTMAQTLKGNILFLLNRISEAKDIFRIAIHSSEDRTERLQMARCYIGMTKIFLKEKNWDRAEEYLAKATSLKKDIKSANEAEEIDALWAKIPK